MPNKSINCAPSAPDSQKHGFAEFSARDFELKSENIIRYNLNLFWENGSIAKIAKCRFFLHLF